MLAPVEPMGEHDKIVGAVIVTLSRPSARPVSIFQTPVSRITLWGLNSYFACHLRELAMTAITPKATNHAALAPLASRFVDVRALSWEKSTIYPGIESKTLLVDPTSGLLTMLMRLQPGARIPDHEHVLIEQTYVLEGSLVCGEGACCAGDYVWRPASSRHEAWGGPQGALLLGMFQMPNRFFKEGGKIEDFLGNNWEERWGEVLARHEQAQFA